MPCCTVSCMKAYKKTSCSACVCPVQRAGHSSKGEEWRLAALKHSRRHSKPSGCSNSDPSPNHPVGQSTPRPSRMNFPVTQHLVKDTRICYTCGETGHLASKCPRPSKTAQVNQLSQHKLRKSVVVGNPYTNVP